jgi:hypothetical protein
MVRSNAQRPIKNRRRNLPQIHYNQITFIMCLPVAAQIALTIASGVAQLSAQAQAAKAQAKAQQQASANEVKRWQHGVSSERLREAQQGTAMAHESLKGHREAEEGMATTRVAAAEGGVEGNAVGLAVAEFSQKNAAYQTALMLQERMNNSSSIMALEGGGLQFQQNMMRINKPIQQPDVLGALLSTAQTASSQWQANRMQGLQRNNWASQNQLMAGDLQLQQARLGLAAQQTINAGGTLNFIRSQQRGAQAGAGLYGVSRLGINRTGR